MFHVRRRPADSQPRRRKKKPLGSANGTNHISQEREGPMLVEVTHSGDGGRRVKLSNEPVEVKENINMCKVAITLLVVPLLLYHIKLGKDVNQFDIN